MNLDKIRRHWPDMLRIIGSIHVGAVRAHDVIRMLSRDGRPTALGDAFAHYGRVPKTLHILRLADDDTYRHQVKSMRNLQEGRHSVARKTFHGDEGELRQPYREGMEDQLGVLGLLLNILVLHNTRYLGAALTRLRRDGHPVHDADAARLSPFLHKHIQMHGRYTFERPALTRLRPLRDPTAPDDTEATR